ncbi:hypothetical protein LCGC14_2329430, partial [marine sediment metagenome]
MRSNVGNNVGSNVGNNVGNNVGSDGRFLAVLMFALCVVLAIVTPASSEPTEPDSVDLRPI